MPTIQKRGDRYTATARIVGHPSASKTFSVKRDAITWARRAEDQMKMGTFVSDREQRRRKALLQKTDPTLLEGLDTYEKKQKKDTKGYEKEKGRIDLLRHIPLAKKRLSQITSSDIVDLIEEWEEEDLSNDAIRNRLVHISGVYKQFRRRRNDLVCPVSIAGMPRKGKARDRRLEQGEEARIFKHMDKTKWPLMVHFVRLAIETAWRQGELRTLTWDRVDFEKGEIYIPGAMTKNGKPRRTPLSPVALDALRQLYRDAPTAKGKNGGSVWGREPTQPEIVNRWRKLVKRAKIEDLRFHDLRHEACSRLAENGMDIMHIASFFSGHESMQMMKRYTHLQKTDHVKEMLALIHERRQAA